MKPVCPRCLDINPGVPGGSPDVPDRGPFAEKLCWPCVAATGETPWQEYQRYTARAAELRADGGELEAAHYESHARFLAGKIRDAAWAKTPKDYRSDPGEPRTAGMVRDCECHPPDAFTLRLRALR